MTRILTASEIAAWKSCRKKWWFRYDQELVPNWPPRPLTYGRLTHTALEAHYLGKDGMNAINAEVEAEKEYWDEEAPFVIHQAQSLLKAYQKRDPVLLDGHTIAFVEREFSVPLRTPSGRKWHAFAFNGKVDLGTYDPHGNLWPWDHKTSAMALNESWLSLNDQMGFYDWAMTQLGEKPMGIIYNLLRKPSIKPRKAETPEEWGVRLLADIESRPAFYFQHSLIVKTGRDLASIERELWECAHEVGRGPIHRNPGNCQIMGCQYMELCKADSPLIRSASYRHERAHVELEGVEE